MFDFDEVLVVLWFDRNFGQTLFNSFLCLTSTYPVNVHAFSAGMRFIHSLICLSVHIVIYSFPVPSEPVLSPGSGDICILEDGWTAVSVDHSRSAQFEHTVLITQHGVDVLTQ